jgi:hypothetical protein
VKELKIIPMGWPCTLGECPTGLFVYGKTLCVKSVHDGPILATGDVAWCGASAEDARNQLIVQPCEAIWEERG